MKMITHFLFKFFVTLGWCCVGTAMGVGMAMGGGMAMGWGMAMGGMLTITGSMTVGGSEAMVGSLITSVQKPWDVGAYTHSRSKWKHLEHR